MTETENEVCYRVVDCRFDLTEPRLGQEHYRTGHLPGAAFLDLNRHLSGPATGDNGRHPLPDEANFAEAISAIGIDGRTHVLAYDDGRSGGAERLWWLLRHFGHERCGTLEGGLNSWRGPLASGEETFPRRDFQCRPAQGDTASREELQARLGDPGLTLVDARAPERYRGESEPIDPVAGHIPGAINLPWNGDLAGLDEVSQAEEVVVYCGSGVTACVILYELSKAGRDDARLYPGSWSEWSSLGLPVEGGQPDGS